ncbi:HEAT repeat domain-containing protein [Micromonospora globispora]
MRGDLAYALGGLGDPSVIPLLQAALDDPHEHVRRAAEWSLGRLGEGSSKGV